MSRRVFSLIVTDTSPLITLALADALDVLLRPGLPVSIPDAVYIEATLICKGRIVDWVKFLFIMVPSRTNAQKATPNRRGSNNRRLWTRDGRRPACYG